jgi:UDP-MurNAc hydroxylase
MKQALEVTMIGHACLRIEGRFGALLCDPWFLNEPIYNFTTWKFPAAVIPPRDVVARLDYLFITHSHEDHFHVPSIDLISRDVQVLLPEYEGHPGLRAQQVERVMRALGFHRIRKLRPWQTINLHGGVPFTVLPPDPDRPHDWENAGFVLEHPDCKLVNINDNIGDEQHFQRIAAWFGRFDIGFVQTTGVSMYPGRFRMPEPQMRAEAARRQFNPVFQQRMIEAFDLKVLAPFAGDFGWLADSHFHCNWANRTTPAIFTEWFQEHYAARGIELAVMYPSDTWSPATGLVQRHPALDWEHHLDEVKKLQQRFQRKLERVHAWIKDTDRTELETRTRVYTARIARWIRQDYIDFTASFEIRIEGQAGFSFVLSANPQDGFTITWPEARSVQVDQTLYLSAETWAAILAGKLMWNIAQWSGECVQHVPFRPEIARFWAWLEYQADLGNRVPQALIEAHQHPHLAHLASAVGCIRPQLGVFPDAAERDWLARRD